MNTVKELVAKHGLDVLIKQPHWPDTDSVRVKYKYGPEYYSHDGTVGCSFQIVDSNQSIWTVPLSIEPNRANHLTHIV